MRLFDPKIELIVYTGGRFDPTRKTTITGLHMGFNVSLTSSKEPNTAEIAVYNLSEETRNLIGGEHRAVDLRAGYGDRIGTIFRGQTMNVFSESEGVDTRTTIFAGDGTKEIETKYVSLSYAKGTTTNRILADLIAATGLPAVIDIYENSTILSGEVYHGRAWDALCKFCSHNALAAVINGGVIEVTQKGLEAMRGATAVVLGPHSGMLGQPVLVDRTDPEKKDGEKQRFGVQVTSLLNYLIMPRRLIKVESAGFSTSLSEVMSKKLNIRSVNGIYVVDTVTHYGDNFGGEFCTVAEGLLQ